MGFTLTDILLFGSATTEDSGTLRIFRRQMLQWGATGHAVEVVVSGIPPLQLLGAVEDSLTSLKAFGGTKENPSDIPVEYTQVDGAIKWGNYSTDGKFDTTVKITTDDVKIEVLVKAGNTETQGGATTMGSFYCCQARSAANAPIYGISGSSNGNTIIGSVGNDGNGVAQALVSNIVRVTGHIYFISYEYKNGTHTLYVKDLTDNIEDTQTETYTLIPPTTNFYIFGNSATTNRVNGGNAIYSCKIWNAGTLAFDGVSVKRDSDNAVGLYDSIRDRFIEPIGTFNAGAVTTPTPSDPMDIYCNNGKISVLDHTNWNVITNPTSQTGQGMFISTDGKLQKANDRGAGVFIPVTVGKQYTVLINKKTVDIGTIIRYGQSNNGTVPNSEEQLLDWYRGTLTDGMIISFTAKRPYFVMQLSANLVEATGGVDNSVEVIEASGDYTFLKYITATGTQYIETDISGAARWVGAGQGTSHSSGSKVIVSAQATADGTIKGAVVWLGSRLGNADTGKFWTLGGASNNMSTSTVPTLDYAEYDVTFGDNTFTGTINNFTFNTVNNQWDIGVWRIGTSFAQNTGDPNYYFIGNIYRQKAYQNDVLVGDFIPAIRNSDSAVGMLDIVSGTFYENAGTGTFGAGDIIGSGETISIDPKGTLATANNLFAIDTAKDVQEIITGATTHNFGVLVCNGTEDWLAHNSVVGWFRLVNSNLFPKTIQQVVCTHYKFSTTQATGQYVSCGSAAGTDPRIIIADNVNFQTTSDTTAFKAWLAAQYAAGTPVIIVYPLATPFEEPAPIAQSMTVVDGDNTVSLTQQGMTPLEVSATYMKGVSVTITEIENANIGNDVDVVIA